jgi:hypothetical protein
MAGTPPSGGKQKAMTNKGPESGEDYQRMLQQKRLRGGPYRTVDHDHAWIVVQCTTHRSQRCAGVTVIRDDDDRNQAECNVCWCTDSDDADQQREGGGGG